MKVIPLNGYLHIEDYQSSEIAWDDNSIQKIISVPENTELSGAFSVGDVIVVNVEDIVKQDVGGQMNSFVKEDYVIAKIIEP